MPAPLPIARIEAMTQDLVDGAQALKGPRARAAALRRVADREARHYRRHVDTCPELAKLHSRWGRKILALARLWDARTAPNSQQCQEYKAKTDREMSADIAGIVSNPDLDTGRKILKLSSLARARRDNAIAMWGSNRVGMGATEDKWYRECLRRAAALRRPAKQPAKPAHPAMVATCLDTQLEALQRSGSRPQGKLPTFGGRKPNDLRWIWSWDRTRLLVGDSIDELEVIDRADWR